MAAKLCQKKIRRQLLPAVRWELALVADASLSGLNWMYGTILTMA